MVTRLNMDLLNGQEEEIVAVANGPSSGAAVQEGLAASALLWLARQSRPHMMLSSELTILWANAAAHTALAEKCDVERRAQSLAAVDPDHNQGLRNFLISSGTSVSSWSMPRANGDGRLVFRAQRMEELELSFIGVTFFGSGSDFRSTYVELDRIFKLTKAQHGVLTDLLAGHEVDAIAQLRKISVETVRTHVRLIYSKVGVNSREALFHILQPFRL